MFVEEIRDLRDARLEEAERAGEGEHEGGDAVAVRFEGNPERLEIEVAVGIRGDALDLEAGHSGGGGVGAVRRVRHEDAATGAAVGVVVGAGDQDAGQLAVGAGVGRERDFVQPRNLREQALEAVHQRKGALGGLLRLHGVDVCQAGEASGHLVDPGIVLHRAATERVEAGVDAEVALRELREVTDDVRLRQLRQRDVVSQQAARRQRRFWYVERRQDAADAPGTAEVERERRAEVVAVHERSVNGLLSGIADRGINVIATLSWLARCFAALSMTVMRQFPALARVRRSVRACAAPRSREAVRVRCGPRRHSRRSSRVRATCR